jgi:hypothetical protein
MAHRASKAFRFGQAFAQIAWEKIHLTMTQERQEKHIDELIAAEEVVVSVK